jgi:gliding motility-associated-like protein
MNPVTKPLDNTMTFLLSVVDLVSSCGGNDEVVVYLNEEGAIIEAHADYDTALINNPVNIPVLLNDLYPSGSKINISICKDPENGEVIINDDNTIKYIPEVRFTGDDYFCYRICIDGSPELCADSLVYIHIKPSGINDLVIVTGLTPNDDDVNDDWIIRGIEDFPDNTVVIFNRWGDKVIDYAGYNNKDKRWDGKNDQGKPVPDGTYFYIVDIKDHGKLTGWIFVRGNNKE